MPACLYGHVGIQQLRPDCAYLAPDGVGHHLVEPAAVEDFEIVVEKCEQLTARDRSGHVVDVRIIERLWIAQHRR